MTSPRLSSQTMFPSSPSISQGLRPMCATSLRARVAAVAALAATAVAVAAAAEPAAAVALAAAALARAAVAPAHHRSERHVWSMLPPGSPPPSWPQNEVKILIDSGTSP